MARISDRAGVNKQLIYYYFGSKAGIYDAMAREVIGELQDLKSRKLRSRGGRLGLRHLLDQLFEFLETSPELVELAVKDVQDRGRDHKISRGIISQVVAEVHAAASEGQGTGYFRDDADLDLVAHQAAVLALGFYALAPAFDETGNAPTPAQWRSAASDVLLRSLSW